MSQFEESNKQKYHIQQYNNQMNIFSEEMAKIMEQMQQQELSRIQSIKDSIYKILVFEVSQIKNLQYDIDKMSKNTEIINGEEEIKRNLDKYIQREENPQKISFNDYFSFIKSVLINQQNVIEQISIHIDDVIQNQFQRYVNQRIQSQENETIDLFS